MINEDGIIELIEHQGVLPLFYDDDTQACIEIMKTLYKAGMRVIEFANRGSNALENFKALLQIRDAELSGLVIGVGTIRSGKDADIFIEAGADFLVSPIFDPKIFDATYMAKKLWIPGCMTPFEVHSSEALGCRLVKIFPANVLGTAFVKAVKEVFPSIMFMPSGGVALNKESIDGWFNAGAIAVGLGSQLISKKLVEQKDFATIGALAAEAMDIVKSLRC